MEKRLRNNIILMLIVVSPTVRISLNTLGDGDWFEDNSYIYLCFHVVLLNIFEGLSAIKLTYLIEDYNRSHDVILCFWRRL